MKILYYALATICILTSCTSKTKSEAKEASTIDYVILAGNIKNSKNDQLRVNSLTSAFSTTIDLSPEGSFLDTLKIEEDNLMIYDGSNIAYLYLQEGDSLTLTYDAKDLLNTMEFSGKGSKPNSYLNVKRKKEKEVLKDAGNVYLLNEADFKVKQSEMEKASVALLDQTNDLSDIYREKERRNIRYNYLNNINNYETYHGSYTKNKDFKTSEDFLKELDGMDYNREDDFKFSYGYSSLVASYCAKEAKKLAEATQIDQDVALLKVINTISNQNIKNYLLYKNAQYGITYTSDLDSYYEAFKNGSTNDDHLKEITNSYTSLKKVSKGQPSPTFVDYENYAGGTTSLEDLKGKYVYIDVWATWCGPCKAEIPFLKEVEKKYHNKNIEFVSISVDTEKDHDKWKNMIAEDNLGGIQLMADNDFKSQFVQDYYIKGIPKFILLDPNGMIIDANAPRPSNEKLIEVFDNLAL